MCIRTYNDIHMCIRTYNDIHMCIRTYNDIPNEIIYTHTIWYLILVVTCLQDLSTMSFIKN